MKKTLDFIIYVDRTIAVAHHNRPVETDTRVRVTATVSWNRGEPGSLCVDSGWEIEGYEGHSLADGRKCELLYDLQQIGDAVKECVERMPAPRATFHTVEAADWRDAIERGRTEGNPVQEGIDRKVREMKK